MDWDNDVFVLSESVLPPSTASTSNNDVKSLKEQEHQLKNKRYASDTNWRCRLSWWVIIVDSVWLASVLLVLIFNRRCCIGLSDAVLMTVLGTTTLNVLGLAFIILQGLFSSEITHKTKQQ